MKRFSFFLLFSDKFFSVELPEFADAIEIVRKKCGWGFTRGGYSS
jgi:hypothetical protein